MTQTLGVMCCGCYRMMGKDGKPFIGMRQGEHGIPEPVNGDVRPDDIAWFGSNAECDEAAKTHGWRVEDREGPNHRCPDCIKAESAPAPYAGMVKRRGAYVNRDCFQPKDKGVS